MQRFDPSADSYRRAPDFELLILKFKPVAYICA